MSKDINVRMELWKAAHALESKAMEAGDIQAMNEAAEWKGKLALGLFTENKEPQEGFNGGNGVKGSLAGTVGVLADVGVRPSE